MLMCNQGLKQNNTHRNKTKQSSKNHCPIKEENTAQCLPKELLQNRSKTRMPISCILEQCCFCILNGQITHRTPSNWMQFLSLATSQSSYHFFPLMPVIYSHSLYRLQKSVNFLRIQTTSPLFYIFYRTRDCATRKKYVLNTLFYQTLSSFHPLPSSYLDVFSSGLSHPNSFYFSHCFNFLGLSSHLCLTSLFFFFSEAKESNPLNIPTNYQPQ